MKLQTKYLLTFLNSTLITLVVVALSIYGFYRLTNTTNYLITVNSRVMEYANQYEKNLAQSRRAEKEFFIFPDNPEKQAKYVKSWDSSMNTVQDNLEKLEKLFTIDKKESFLEKILQAKRIIKENRREWDIVVTKFKETKSYDTVNKAEYGTFKKRVHILEEIGKEISIYGVAEMEKGRQEIDKTEKQTQTMIKIVAAVAVFLGIIIPIVFARHMTSTIVQLSEIADDISRGKIGQEIGVVRKDELGDLAQSIKRMQTSFRIMLEKLGK